MRGWTLHGRKYRKIPGKVKRTCITWKEEKRNPGDSGNQ